MTYLVSTGGYGAAYDQRYSKVETLERARDIAREKAKDGDSVVIECVYTAATGHELLVVEETYNMHYSVDMYTDGYCYDTHELDSLREAKEYACKYIDEIVHQRYGEDFHGYVDVVICRMGEEFPEWETETTYNF